MRNVLASRVLHEAAKSAGVSLCCTVSSCGTSAFTSQGQPRPERSEMQLSEDGSRNCRRDHGKVLQHRHIADLQDVEVIENRMRLSRGEISSIVFAKKSQQALMTDDRKAARTSRGTILAAQKVQSTPHLLAWLYFNCRLQ